VEGGSKDNAIPRSAKAELVLESEGEFTDLLEEVVRLEETYQKEYALTDPGITLHCAETGKASRALTQESAQKLVTALMNLPAGIQRMSFSMPGLVQTSLNLGILRTEEKEAVLSYCVRSSVESEKRHLTDQLRCLMEQLGGSVEELGDYPGWQYRQESPLREKMIEVYTRLYGEAPVVQSMHAGVECGFFAGRLPGLDCVSFGPNLRDIHTPQESMEAESVRRTWEYLLEVLKELK
jgi:dipeptidase D